MIEGFVMLRPRIAIRILMVLAAALIVTAGVSGARSGADARFLWVVAACTAMVAWIAWTWRGARE